jgi:hypothetical protein
MEMCRADNARLNKSVDIVSYFLTVHKNCVTYDVRVDAINYKLRTRHFERGAESIRGRYMKQVVQSHKSEISHVHIGSKASLTRSTKGELLEYVSVVGQNLVFTPTGQRLDFMVIFLCPSF